MFFTHGSRCCPDIEWKITYVGSAEDERYDQILDTVLVGPVPVGSNKFVFEVRRDFFRFFYILCVKKNKPYSESQTLPRA